MDNGVPEFDDPTYAVKRRWLWRVSRAVALIHMSLAIAVLASLAILDFELLFRDLVRIDWRVAGVIGALAVLFAWTPVPFQAGSLLVSPLVLWVAQLRLRGRQARVPALGAFAVGVGVTVVALIGQTYMLAAGPVMIAAQPHFFYAHTEFVAFFDILGTAVIAFFPLVALLIATWFAPVHDPNLCRQCGYDLRGSRCSPSCPECGHMIPLNQSQEASEA